MVRSGSLADPIRQRLSPSEHLSHSSSSTVMALLEASRSRSWPSCARSLRIALLVASQPRNWPSCARSRRIRASLPRNGASCVRCKRLPRLMQQRHSRSQVQHSSRRRHQEARKDLHGPIQRLYQNGVRSCSMRHQDRRPSPCTRRRRTRRRCTRRRRTQGSRQRRSWLRPWCSAIRQNPRDATWTTSRIMAPSLRMMAQL